MLSIFQFFATKTDASALRMLNGAPPPRPPRMAAGLVQPRTSLPQHDRWAGPGLVPLPYLRLDVFANGTAAGLALGRFPCHMLFNVRVPAGRRLHGRWTGPGRVSSPHASQCPPACGYWHRAIKAGRGALVLPAA